MEIAITHSSTACVLLEIGSVRILTDPVLDEGRKTYHLGPGILATRYIGPAIRPQDIPPLDAVLLSHFHHLDNLDDSGRAMLRGSTTVITVPHKANELPVKAVGLTAWQETTITGKSGEQIRVTAVPAQHGPWWLPEVHRVTGFVLQWSGQEHGALYISGDTVFFGGLETIPERFPIGTALLHLGAVHFWPPWPQFLRFTFTAKKAAHMAKLLNPKTIIPVHYERSVWSHFRESVENYNTQFLSVGMADKVNWLEHGKRTVITV